MFRRHYNVPMMLLWSGMAAVLLVPGWPFAEKVRAAMDLNGPQGTLLGLLALLFVAYNAAKWWNLQSLYRARAEARAAPFGVRNVGAGDADYRPNPELDFLKPDDEKP